MGGALCSVVKGEGVAWAAPREPAVPDHNLRCQLPSLVLRGEDFQAEARPKGRGGCCGETGFRTKGGDQETLEGVQGAFQEGGDVTRLAQRGGE